MPAEKTYPMSAKSRQFVRLIMATSDIIVTNVFQIQRIGQRSTRNQKIGILKSFEY